MCMKLLRCGRLLVIKKSYDMVSDQATASHHLHKQTAKVAFFYSMGNQKKTASFFRHLAIRVNKGDTGDKGEL